MPKEYKVDPRLLTWIKNNMQGCPQTPSDLLKIKRLDRWKTNRSTSTEGYLTPKWLQEERGNFSLFGEMENLEYLRLSKTELDDWSFLTQCKALQVLDLGESNFTDCRLLAELPALEKVYLPPRRKLRHTEVLDSLNVTGGDTPELVEDQPFYKDEDYRDMPVVDGGELTIDYQYEGYPGVRCVSVDFHGKEPEGWKDFPHGNDEEDNWKNLTPEERKELAAQLAESIRKEKVLELCLSLEPWGEENYLAGEFAPGWAALWYDDTERGASYTVYNSDYDTVEELCPIEIGGQSPVAKQWALENMDLAARIVEHFLLTGQLLPGSKWMVDEWDG